MIPRLRCPHCDGATASRSSKSITRLTRDIYVQCQDVECGHTFVAQVTVVRTLSPSARPRAGLHIPLWNAGAVAARAAAPGALGPAANDDAVERAAEA